MDLQLHGKTNLAIELAKKVNGEIVSCDSMQIYKEMNIGTAKPTIEEMNGIMHYMIDIVDPEERFSVSEYKIQAEKCIQKILSKNKVPIVVGGTGLYLNSLLYNIEYAETKMNEKYREELERRAETHGLESLYNEARKIDKEAMMKISPNDKKRIIRVLEIYKETGKTKTEQELNSRKKDIPFDYHVFAINFDRQILYDRINKRVDTMIKNGLIQEVEHLTKNYPNMKTAIQSIGYKEVLEYLEGNLTKEEMIEKIKQETRRYAKRQITWFKKNKNTIWIDGLESKEKNIQTIIEEVYK